MGCVCGKPYAIDDSKESPGERSSNKAISDLRAPRSVYSRREESYQGKDRLDNSSYEGRVILIDKQVNGSVRLQGENFERKREKAEYTSAVHHPGVGMVPRATEGEQVAAGWPPWLAAVAGEAIKGWLPRRADSFEKLDKVLSDDKKRALYDQYGEAGVKSTVGGAGGYTATNPFDLFEAFFGPSMGGFPGMDGSGFGASRRSTVAKGEDLRYDMTLEFSVAIFGAEKEFELSHLETCEVCAGTGAKVGSKMRICSTCGGRGQVMRTEQTPFGMFSQVSVCPNCGGDGEMISESCRKCSGAGRIRVRKDIKVKIPPGVSKGSILRVAGEGDAGPKGGPPGDLYVYLDIEEIPEIQRDGINLSSTISISYLDAILGTVVKVKTVEGMTDLQIPPGTQPGDVLVLARKGAPKLNRPSIRGDHLFTVKVSIPKRISAKERELLEELASLGNAPANRSKTRPKVKQPDENTESEKVPITENKDESEDQNDLWKKLKDFAGSVANGAIKWFKDNI